MKILVVEDEEKIARFIELELVHEGYEVTKTVSGREGLSLAETGGFDLMVLDVMLPELNGLEVLRRLRKTSEMPVIMLTARDAVMDKVSGLDAGADDYITKPFAIEELLARIRVALKKHGAAQNTGQKKPSASPDILTYENLSVDLSKRIVSYNGETITLTFREFELLRELLENKNIVLSRDTLLHKVCGYDYVGETNVIDVYVRYLRTKIDDRFGIKMIQTVRCVGYVIRE
ncbi:MAG: response regulator transcription factor [Alistipes sp.]|nr:response regulator transcription factor [Alistipes sp.]